MSIFGRACRRRKLKVNTNNRKVTVSQNKDTGKEMKLEERLWRELGIPHILGGCSEKIVE